MIIYNMMITMYVLFLTLKDTFSGIQGRNLMPTAPPDVATCAGCVYSHPA